MLRKPPFPQELWRNMPREDITIVTRNEWGAKSPIIEERFSKFPVDKVVMGYTETEPCTTQEECMKTMRELQQLHMSQGQSDIRYNFVMGADKRVYEGRGINTRAGHHYRYKDLNGGNYEFVHTAIRGKLPDAALSGLLWQFMDKLEFDGYLAERPEFFQDYVDELPEPDISKLQVDIETNVLESLD